MIIYLDNNMAKHSIQSVKVGIFIGGDFFGYKEISTGMPYDSSVIAQGRCSAYILQKNVLQNLIRAAPEVSQSHDNLVIKLYLNSSVATWLSTTMAITLKLSFYETYLLYVTFQQVSELLSAAMAQAIVGQDKTIELRQMKTTLKNTLSCIHDEVSESRSLDTISSDDVFSIVSIYCS